MYNLKTSICICIFICTASITAQNVVIPDATFKDRLLNHNPVIDTNNDGEIQVAEALDFTTSLQLSGSSSNPTNIEDLTGIEAFINVSTINAGNNDLTTVNFTENIELRNLSLGNNTIAEIDLSGNPLLRNLVIFDNLLQEIDVSSNPELRFLDINQNNISDLDLSENNLLLILNAAECSLSTIDLSSNTNLDTLYLLANPLESVDLRQNTALTELFIGATLIRGINLSENPQLEKLDIRANPLLEEINLKNSDNDNIDITSSFPSNFTNLPLLERVCIDDVNSDLAAFILDQVAHPVTFSEDCSFLGTEENTLAAFIIYPNPTRDFVTISTKEEITSIQLFTLTGVILKDNAIINNRLNIENIANGVYLLKVKFKNGTHSTRKIIKS